MILVLRKRHIIIVLLIIIAGIITLVAYKTATPALSSTMFGRVIVIDAGHGGNDPGVIGKSGSIEKQINLEIAKKTAELLRNSGATVIMTREKDMSLADDKRGDLNARVSLATNNKADLYISIHGNSFPRIPSAHGAQVFYSISNPQSEQLANSIQNQMQLLGTTNRVALAHKDAYILKHLTCAAVITEVGFLSNTKEEEMLNTSEYQWDISYALVKGIIEYFPTKDQ